MRSQHFCAMLSMRLARLRMAWSRLAMPALAFCIMGRIIPDLPTGLFWLRHLGEASWRPWSAATVRSSR